MAPASRRACARHRSGRRASVSAVNANHLRKRRCHVRRDGRGGCRARAGTSSFRVGVRRIRDQAADRLPNRAAVGRCIRRRAANDPTCRKRMRQIRLTCDHGRSCHHPGRIAPASRSRTSVAHAKPTACTPWSSWTATVGPFACPVAFATASTTIAADPESGDRVYRRRSGLPPLLVACHRHLPHFPS